MSCTRCAKCGGGGIFVWAKPVPRRATLCIAAGCAVDERILVDELDMMGIPRDRIVVDPRAILIREEDRTSEGQRLAHISSTLSGNGAALAHRERLVDGIEASDDPLISTRSEAYAVSFGRRSD